MRDDIFRFPAPLEQGTMLGHDGTLAPEEVEHLENLGYVVAHYKSFSGQRLIQAYFEGLAKGLIEMDVKTFKSMDTIRKQMSKMEKGQDDLKAKDTSSKVDVVQLLKGGVKPDVGATPTRRRGRPPGKANGVD